METTQERILNIQATNDGRDGKDEYLITPPLSLWGERILFYIEYLIADKIRNGNLVMSGKFKIIKMLDDLGFSRENRKKIKMEFEGSEKMTRTKLNFFLKKHNGFQPKVDTNIFEKFKLKNGIISFEFSVQYLERNLKPIVDRFMITTLEEVKGYGRDASYKLARWIKSRVSLKLNDSQYVKNQENNVIALREKYKENTLEEVQSSLSKIYDMDLSKVKSKEKIYDKVVGIQKQPLPLDISLNKLRKMFYGIYENWRYKKGNGEGEYEDWKIANATFLNNIVKKTIKEISEYSFYEISLPTFQDNLDENGEEDKIIRVMVTVKTGIYTKEIKNLTVGVRQNLKLALIQNKRNHGGFNINEPMKIDINPEDVVIAKESNNLEELERNVEFGVGILSDNLSKKTLIGVNENPKPMDVIENKSIVVGEETSELMEDPPIFESEPMFWEQKEPANIEEMMPVMTELPENLEITDELFFEVNEERKKLLKEQKELEEKLAQINSEISKKW